MVKRRLKFAPPTLLLSISLFALFACAEPNPAKAPLAASPTTPASKTMTSFTPALQCMDGLLAAAGKQGIAVTAVSIPSSSKKVSVDTKEMLIRALTMMSRNSKAFVFVDYDADNTRVFTEAQRASGQAGHRVPDYYIRGAISSIDDSVLNSEAKATVYPPWAGPSDQVVSMVAVDLNVGETVSRRVLANAASSNVMAVVKVADQDDYGGKLGQGGVSATVSLSKSEGLGAAIRALIELGTIESMGQLTGVPYWDCLRINKTNPTITENVRAWFDSIPETEQVAQVQRKLIQAGLYKGPPDGKTNPEFVRLTAAYQAHNQLIADGRVNFDLYFSMLNDGELAAATLPGKWYDALPLIPKEPPLMLTVASERGAMPVYHRGEILQTTVALSHDARLYCYYQDGEGTIVRLFPNHLLGGGSQVSAGIVPLSADGQPIKIRLDTANVTERVACFADKSNLVLSPELDAGEMQPLKLRSLGELDRKIRQSNADMVTSTLEVKVQ